MTATQDEIQTLIYKTEFYIINKDYDILLEEEYGSTSKSTKAFNKLQLLRMLLKALKLQFNLDHTAPVATRLYHKIKGCTGLNLNTLPAINEDLIVYSIEVNDILVGNIIIATYGQLLANLPQDANNVITVSVFNQYFSNLYPTAKIYKNLITITNGLIITHSLNSTQVAVQFHTSTGPIFCDFTILGLNSIQLVSNVVIPDVNIIILG